MYDNRLFFLPFLFPPIKKEEEKENELVIPVLKKLFLVIHSIFIYWTVFV